MQRLSNLQKEVKRGRGIERRGKSNLIPFCLRIDSNANHEKGEKTYNAFAVNGLEQPKRTRQVAPSES